MNHVDCDAPASTIAVAAGRRDEWPEAEAMCKDDRVPTAKMMALLIKNISNSRTIHAFISPNAVLDFSTFHSMSYATMKGTDCLTEVDAMRVCQFELRRSERSRARAFSNYSARSLCSAQSVGANRCGRAHWGWAS